MKLSCRKNGNIYNTDSTYNILAYRFFENQRWKKLYCYTAAIILLCVIGFRTENMGLYDVKNIYFPQFDSLQRMSMAEMFKEYPVMRGNLFQIFTKLYQVFSENKYVWLLFTSIPYIAAMTHTIKSIH